MQYYENKIINMILPEGLLELHLSNTEDKDIDEKD